MRNLSFGLDGLKSIGQHNFPFAFDLVIVNIYTVISNRKLRLLRPLLHTLPATMYPPSSQSFPFPYSPSPLPISIDASSCILRAAKATSNSTRPPNARDQMQQVHSSPLPHPLPNLIPRRLFTSLLSVGRCNGRFKFFHHAAVGVRLCIDVSDRTRQLHLKRILCPNPKLRANSSHLLSRATCVGCKPSATTLQQPTAPC